MSGGKRRVVFRLLAVQPLIASPVRRLREPDFLDVTIEAFRPVQGMSLSSDVIEIKAKAAIAAHLRVSAWTCPRV